MGDLSCKQVTGHFSFRPTGAEQGARHEAGGRHQSVFLGLGSLEKGVTSRWIVGQEGDRDLTVSVIDLANAHVEKANPLGQTTVLRDRDHDLVREGDGADIRLGAVDLARRLLGWGGEGEVAVHRKGLLGQAHDLVREGLCCSPTLLALLMRSAVN